LDLLLNLLHSCPVFRTEEYILLSILSLLKRVYQFSFEAISINSFILNPISKSSAEIHSISSQESHTVPFGKYDFVETLSISS